LGLKLLQPPAALQVDKHYASDNCGTVNITADGLLMCERSNGIRVVNRQTLKTVRSVNDTSTTRWGEIIQPEGVVVANWFNWTEKIAEVIILDSISLKKSRSLYKQLSDELTFYRMAQKLSLVYVLDREEKQLVICDLVDDQIRKLPVTGTNYPLPICILPDSTLLIGDYTEDGDVRKYKVEKTTLTLLWQFPHIPRPSGISFDPKSELIHVCTFKGPLLILSIDGK